MNLALQLTLTNWLLACAPMLTVTVLMLGFGWGGKKAGPAGFVVAAVLAWTSFGTGGGLLWTSTVQGVLLSLRVIYIIIPALVLYHVAEAAGGIRNIGWSVSEMTQNHILQLLILAFGFTSFLQGVAGFGVPVAVVAPLLIGIGYPPVQAVAAALIGHAWSVSMGNMASSFQALLSVTTLPPHEVGVMIAFLLGLAGMATAVSVAHLHAGWGAVGRWPIIVAVLGGVTALTQFVLAWLNLWVIATFGAGLVCLLLGFGLARLKRYQGPSRPSYLPPKPEWDRVRVVERPKDLRRMSFHLAFAPYYALIVIVGLATFIRPLHDLLGSVRLEYAFGETRTALGHVMPGRVWKLAPFGHPGGLLLYTSFVGWLCYKLNGCWPQEKAGIFRKTMKQAYPTSVGIISMVAMASVMSTSGMIHILAKGAAAVSGTAFPFFSPIVGLVGCFITGNNTNSNILFGSFQTKVAELIGKDPVIVGASQSTGGSLGSMIAPAKVIVGCSTAGLAGREGEVFRRVTPYCVAQILLVGAVTWWLTL